MEQNRKLKKLSIIILGLFLMLALCGRETSAQIDNYLIQPEDVLKITVYEHDDLATRTRVNKNGEISFPLLETVPVAGMTVQEIEDTLKTALEKDYLVNAHVQVFIENYHAKQVSVLGAVAKPGKYDLNTEKETSVLEAIAMAGGFTDVAAVNGTKIIRTKGDEKQTIAVRITDITKKSKKGMKDTDVYLESGDIVFVPESFF